MSHVYITFSTYGPSLPNTIKILSYLNKCIKGEKTYCYYTAESLITPSHLNYFIPLSEEEKKEAEEAYNLELERLIEYGLLPARYAESMFQNILKCEYDDIGPIIFRSKKTKLFIQVHSAPYGGLDGLLTLLDCLGNEIISYSEGFKEQNFNREKIDWRNYE